MMAGRHAGLTSTGTAALAAATFLCIGLLTARPAQAYLQLSFDVSGETVRLEWQSPRVRWYATDRSAPGVPASEFQRAMARALSTWEDVPTASIAFDFAGFTSAAPFEDDTLSVFGFADEPDLERVLGATTWIVDELTGEVVEADVFFNTAFTWSTAAAGDPARFDLESVALHEMGHFVGLGHSAVGETEMREGGRRVIASGAVMFPIAFGRGNTADRVLQPDDIAGVSDLYPDAGFRDRTGAARGRVLRNGRAVLGAHVTAFNPVTGEIIGGFALGEGGEFQIAGLTPGAHVIRVEPLDDAEVDSFFSASGIDVDFRATFHPRLFVAPRGGVGERFDVTVNAK
jgi:Matrixin